MLETISPVINSTLTTHVAESYLRAYIDKLMTCSIDGNPIITRCDDAAEFYNVTRDTQFYPANHSFNNELSLFITLNSGYYTKILTINSLFISDDSMKLFATNDTFSSHRDRISNDGIHVPSALITFASLSFEDDSSANDYNYGFYLMSNGKQSDTSENAIIVGIPVNAQNPGTMQFYSTENLIYTSFCNQYRFIIFAKLRGIIDGIDDKYIIMYSCHYSYYNTWSSSIDYRYYGLEIPGVIHIIDRDTEILNNFRLDMPTNNNGKISTAPPYGSHSIPSYVIKRNIGSEIDADASIRNFVYKDQWISDDIFYIDGAQFNENMTIDGRYFIPLGNKLYLWVR
jgi:hypothetical protein